MLTQPPRLADSVRAPPLDSTSLQAALLLAARLVAHGAHWPFILEAAFAADIPRLIVKAQRRFLGAAPLQLAASDALVRAGPAPARARPPLRARRFWKLL